MLYPFKVPKEQLYVFEIAQRLGIPLRLVSHRIATSTCQEKACLLGWPVEHVVKALYFKNGCHRVGIVTPEMGHDVNLKELLHTVFGLSRRAAKKYGLNGGMPPGMEKGTCTPFPFQATVGNDIHDIIIVNYPTVNKQLVDISLGGEGEHSHKVSVHLPYWGIYTILKRKFGSRIHDYQVSENQQRLLSVAHIEK